MANKVIDNLKKSSYLVNYYKVYLPRNSVTFEQICDFTDWLLDNFNENDIRYTTQNDMHIFLFRNEEDAIAFKLKFLG